MVYFDHEKLDVYQQALVFVGWVGGFLDAHDARIAARDHLDRASTSIVLNIAEANGKFSMKDRCRFLDIAYGSALECGACLDVYVAKRLASPEDARAGKETLKRVVSMVVKLKISLADRVSEEPAAYLCDESDS